MKVIDDEDVYNNVYNYNQGDKIMELYFNPTQKMEADIEVLRGYNQQGILTIFGARVWSAIH